MPSSPIDSLGVILMNIHAAGSMPPDSDIYYGFTRFAIELNEKDAEQIHLYPPTDTRFRPDQRSVGAWL